MKSVLIQLFERDLRNLKKELSAYSSEESIWKVSENITNSTGTLVLHLVGNLNHFIGSVMGDSGFVRDREAEFSLRNVPRQVMLDQIDSTIDVVMKSLYDFPEEKFSDSYPQQVFKEPMTYQYFMVHLVGHLNYHLGQVNYHRRLLDL